MIVAEKGAQMQKNADQAPASFSQSEGWLLIFGFVTVSVVFAAFVALVTGYSSSISLPMLSIAGIVLLLIALTGVAYVFSRLGLHDKGQALGLPEGSIQSVIALSLIVLFAILSIFLFTEMGKSSLRPLKGVSETERESLIQRLGPTFAGWEREQPDPGATLGVAPGATSATYTVFVRDTGIDARNDVGKQLIVLIGTLMTSVVSFYFGSRATVAGADASRSSTADRPAISPAIIRIEPEAGIPRGRRTTVTIDATGVSDASDLSFKKDNESLPVSGLRVIDTGIVCDVSPSTTSPLGSYDLNVLRNGRSIVSQSAALKVIE